MTLSDKLQAADRWFTVVFEGDLLAIKENPHRIVSAFGKPMTIGFGDAFVRLDNAEDRLDKAIAAIEARNPDGSFVYPDFVRLPLASILAAPSDTGGG